MANIFDKFKDSVVGSSGRILDFNPKISPTGDFVKTYDINTVIQSWNNILITQRGTKDHDPEFGSNLYNYIFEPADNKTKESIKKEIIYVLGRYDNRANIKEVVVSFLKNKKGFNVIVTADYFGSQRNLSVTIDETIYQM